MTTDALAIVFSPNLLRAPHNDFLMIMSNMQHTNKLVKALVTHVRVLEFAASTNR
jgi:GTPase-activating protein BEM2